MEVLDCGHALALVGAPDGPFWGDLAHGYACGAMMQIHGGSPWNQLMDPRTDRDAAMGFMRTWGIKTTEHWYQVVNRLLEADYSDRTVDVVLELRRDVIASRGGWDLPAWQSAITALVVERGVGAAQAQQVAEVAALIDRYETRFREIGVLPTGGLVASIAAYDHGRAACQARWGVGAGHTDRATAEAIVRDAGSRAREVYGSWAEFGAGYLLGRVLSYDNGEFGHMYTSGVGPYRVLMSDPLSPWLALPFR